MTKKFLGYKKTAILQWGIIDQYIVVLRYSDDDAEHTYQIDVILDGKTAVYGEYDHPNCASIEFETIKKIDCESCFI